MNEDILGASSYNYTGYESAFVPTPPMSKEALATVANMNTEGPQRSTGDVRPGGEPPAPPAPAKVETTTMEQTSQPTKVANENDMRVRIRVPSDYITGLTQGSRLKEFAPQNFGGIVFPYTPQITLEHKAEYTQQQPLHTNYAINFYKNSQVTDISITGKFTVQNDRDGLLYLSTVRLLAALTKMRFGGQGGDPDSGAPPPVCRLDAYGEYMLKNVPVSIISFKHDLPDDVDFYTIKTNSSDFGRAAVPTRSTITVVCRPMYSRAEMQKISVTGYLDPAKFKGGGYL
jgi:hypothetical protein